MLFTNLMQFLKVAEQIFTILDQNNPNPTTELIYKTPFQLLIAVILSAQATDVSVNKACKELFELANTAEKMIQLGEIKLKSKIRSIGLFNTKAKNIIKTRPTKKRKTFPIALTWLFNLSQK